MFGKQFACNLSYTIDTQASDHLVESESLDALPDTLEHLCHRLVAISLAQLLLHSGSLEQTVVVGNKDTIEIIDRSNAELVVKVGNDTRPKSFDIGTILATPELQSLYHLLATMMVGADIILALAHQTSAARRTIVREDNLLSNHLLGSIALLIKPRHLRDDLASLLHKDITAYRETQRTDIRLVVERGTRHDRPADGCGVEFCHWSDMPGHAHLERHGTYHGR